jgi:hypothetical protein
MTDLPDTLNVDPKLEALELGLDACVFERGQDGLTPYLLLDASANVDVPVMLEGFGEPARCLFDGQAFEDLSDVAPWLAAPNRYGGLWDWFFEDAWGKNTGIIILSDLPMAKLKTHLKKFLRVEDEDGEAFFFKFYRPEHFNTYIPVLDPPQRAAIAKGLGRVFTEDKTDAGVLIDHTFEPGGGHKAKAVDLIKMGEPLRIKPPSADAVDAILELARKS